MARSRMGKCEHCKKQKSIYSRGICFKCYSDPTIRVKYKRKYHVPKEESLEQLERQIAIPPGPYENGLVMNKSEADAEVRMLRHTAEKFGLKTTTIAFTEQSSDWLVAADWVEDRGHLVLAVEIRFIMEQAHNYMGNEHQRLRNPCKCGNKSEHLPFLNPDININSIGWSCKKCHKDTDYYYTWFERLMAWNLMNPRGAGHG